MNIQPRPTQSRRRLTATAGVSKATRRAFVYVLTGWTQREILGLFDDHDIAPDRSISVPDESSSRRHLALQCIGTLDLTQASDERKLLDVFEVLLRTTVDNGSTYGTYENLVELLEHDGFRVDPITKQISAAKFDLAPQSLAALTDASAIHEHLARLMATVDDDPRAAVSSAKELIESTAKLVLRERGEAYDTKADLPELVTQAQRSLNLLAARVTAAEAEPAGVRPMKKVLGGLYQLTQAMTELRNAAGTGHGREGVPEWIAPRHARLAAHAAVTWCDFMLETLADPNAPWRREA